MSRLLKIFAAFIAAIMIIHSVALGKTYETGGILPDPSQVQSMSIQELEARYGGNTATDVEYFDWRNNNSVNWMTEVKNQGGCGACAAFASAGHLEALIRIINNDSTMEIDLSEQAIFSCAGGDCPTGLYMGDAFTYVDNYGIPDEDCLPYTEVDDNCDALCSDAGERSYQIDGWELLWQYNVDNALLKNVIMEQPVACYLEVYADFMSYSSGVYEYKTGNKRGGHFVVIVGWDDADDCWICKNSWGPGWGENGYFRIKRDEVCIGSWAMVATYSGGATPTPRPTATPTPPMELGVALEMPGYSFASGDSFYLDVRLTNPGMPKPAALCVLLETAGVYWCWPGWTLLSESFDCKMMDLPLGGSTVNIIPEFTWPDIGSSSEPLYFWGVLLDPTLTEIMGNYQRISWTY